MFDIHCRFFHSPGHCMRVQDCYSIAYEPSIHRHMKRYNLASSAILTNLHRLQHSTCTVHCYTSTGSQTLELIARHRSSIVSL